MLEKLVKCLFTAPKNYLLLRILLFTVQLIPLIYCFFYRSLNYSYRSNNNIPKVNLTFIAFCNFAMIICFGFLSKLDSKIYFNIKRFELNSEFVFLTHFPFLH